jgi:uncharacterized membrane protein YfcA
MADRVGKKASYVSPLIFLGLPPQHAIATAVFAFLGMCIVGLFVYHRGGKADFRIGIPAAILGSCGALMGTFLMTSIPSDILQKAIGISMLVILCLLVARRDLGVRKIQDSPVRNSPIRRKIGIHSATIAGGTSIIATYVLLLFFGKTYLESAGTRKILFFGVNTVGALMYGSAGLIDWHYAWVLFIGVSIGSYIGATHALKKGDKWVRWLFVPVVVLSALKLLI